MAIISQENIPVVGKQYNHYDDGKVRPSRQSVVKVTKVIPYSEVNDKLKILISTEQEHHNWIYASKTDFVVFADTINENDPLTKEQIYIRTKDNGWFSINHETYFDSGRLDIDHTLTDSVIELLHEGAYDYTTEEIKQILTELV